MKGRPLRRTRSARVRRPRGASAWCCSGGSGGGAVQAALPCRGPRSGQRPHGDMPARRSRGTRARPLWLRPQSRGQRGGPEREGGHSLPGLAHAAASGAGRWLPRVPWLRVALVSPAGATLAQPRGPSVARWTPWAVPTSAPQACTPFLITSPKVNSEHARHRPPPWARTPPGFLQLCLCCGSPEVAVAGLAPRAGAAGRWIPFPSVSRSRVP